MNAKRERISTPNIITLPQPSAQDALQRSQQREAQAVQDTFYLADYHSERAVCGAVLQRPELYPSLADTLQPGDFYSILHAYTWYAFGEVINANQEIDIITVAAVVKRDKRFQAQNVDEEMAQLFAAAPNADNIEAYADNVREAALRIRVLHAAATIWNAAIVKDKPLDMFIDEVNTLLFAATEQVNDYNEGIKAIVSDYYDKMEAGRAAKQRPALSTGIASLDAIHSSGLYHGDVSIWAGAEGMGKTSLVLSVLLNMLMSGTIKGAVIFSLEMMAREEIMRLFTTMETGISREQQRQYDMTDKEWQTFVTTMGVVSNLPLKIVDKYPEMTPLQIRRKLRRHMLDMPVDVVVIDGLWLMKATTEGLERHREIHEITVDLNAIAKDFGVHIMLTHQYRDKILDYRDKRPKLFYLAESASVRRNATIINGLFREDYWDRSKRGIGFPLEVHNLKDRNFGKEGEIAEVRYDDKYARYR